MFLACESAKIPSSYYFPPIGYQHFGGDDHTEFVFPRLLLAD